MAFTFFTTTNAQIVNVPDAKFKAALLQKLDLLDYNTWVARTSDGTSDGSPVQIDSNNNNEIEVSEVENIEQLHLSNLDNTNQITDLTGISSFKSLKKLVCSNNKLTSLDLTSLKELSWLECSNNLITSLNLSDSKKLTYLKCSDNQLTSLDLTATKDLIWLYCSNNLFTTLNCNFLEKLYIFECINNRFLESIFIKNNDNGYTEYDYTEGNPNLKYVCVDDLRIIGVKDLRDFLGLKFEVNSYCSFTPGGSFYTIQGKTKLDSNNNGCDLADIGYPNLKFSISDGTNSGSLIASATGNYYIPVETGTQTITPALENPSYFNISPTNAIITFPTQPSPFTQDFCITTNGVHPDLEVTVLPINRARPGFDASYKIICKNKGTNTQSGSVNLTFNDAVLDFVSSNPIVSSQTVNNLSWDFTDLKPFETREIIVTVNVNSPMETPAVNIADVLNFNATLTSAATDETPLDNSFVLNQVVVGSYDPNDKTCLEGTTIPPSAVGKYVHYMIRFENKGTAEAQNVVVKDMIDTSKFDISSLLVTQGSHPFVTKISETNKVEFIFENINLPFDDATNDGYVAFKIKTKPSLVVGDSFSNTASIYFDYNFPIVTNTATTSVLQSLGNQDFKFDSYFRIYPNPAKDFLNIDVKQQIEVTSISIFNMLGQQILVIPNAQQTKQIDVSSLQTGNYFIKVSSNKGNSNTRFIKN